jgi:VanZ family protein
LHGCAVAERSRWWAFVPALAWAAVVWLIGGMSSLPSAPDTTGLDKLGHFGMYGVLGFLTGRGWVAVDGGRANGVMRAVWPVLLVMALGAADELRQATLPGRSAELADWVADTAGAALGFLIAVRWGRQRERLSE